MKKTSRKTAAKLPDNTGWSPFDENSAIEAEEVKVKKPRKVAAKPAAKVSEEKAEIKTEVKGSVSEAPAKKTIREGERIAKRLARAGVCSRREAERLIEQGFVAVNGRTLKTAAFNVNYRDKITIHGEPIPEAGAVRMWRYHKPQGVITTNSDPQGRPTVFSKLPPTMPRVISVGRLDFNTEGLLLLTNDGSVARHIELPANAWIRNYRVRVYGDVKPKKLAELAEGVMISGIRYEPMKVTIEKSEAERASANTWLNVSIKEGKNREVRKAMEYLGLQVTRLLRVSFGPFQLDDLPRGGVEEIPRRVLREYLGKLIDDAEKKTSEKKTGEKK